MCGVAAIYSYRPEGPPVDRGELIRIRDRMAPRGPDGSGEWYSADGRVGLGHRRLSIIDLSRRAAQPMVLERDQFPQAADGLHRATDRRTPSRLAVSYNGEIYNYRVLRSGLESRGAIFFSESDTEVLLRLYEEEGEGVVRRLRGMFAFALWDEARAALLLARDPYGIKPLYYADDGNTLRAASQVKALMAGGAVSSDRDPAGMAGFLLFGSVPEPWTILEGIRAVPAGACLWADERGVHAPKTYFSIPAAFKAGLNGRSAPAPEEMEDAAKAALLESVRYHLIADVPVGAFLSSGLDSASVVGIMSGLAHEDIRTVTLSFDEFRGKAEDEAPLAETVAAHYGARHAARGVTEADFRKSLPRLLEDMDQPSMDGVNTWFVSRAARETGLKVAVSGLGGDELFGGYPSFQDIPRWARRFSLPSRVPGLGDLFLRAHRALVRRSGGRPGSASRIRNSVPRVLLSPKAGGFLKYAGTYAGAYLLRRGLFMPWELPGLIGKDAAEEGLRRLDPLAHIGDRMHPDPGTPFGRVASLEASLYMRNQLLRDADWAGMAHGLEIRLPLVDSVLLETLAPLLASRGKWKDKWVLPETPEKPLPAAVLTRPKTGFTVPIHEWLLRNDDLDAWRGVPSLRHEGCHWSRRWAYTVMKMYGV